MTSKNVSYKEVQRLYDEGQNIFRRPSVGPLIDRIKELESQFIKFVTPTSFSNLTASSIDLYAIDSKGEEEKIEDLYWFEGNFVHDWRGAAVHDTYSFRFVISLETQTFEFTVENGRLKEVEIAFSLHNKLFPICAVAYHEELDDQGDRFCRMCGQPLGVEYPK
jgi:hypothetical protein